MRSQRCWWVSMIGMGHRRVLPGCGRQPGRDRQGRGLLEKSSSDHWLLVIGHWSLVIGHWCDATTSVRRGSPDHCGEHLRLRGPSGGCRHSRLDPSHPGVLAAMPGVAGVEPDGRCPQECPGPIAQTPGFHGGCRLQRCSPQWSGDPRRTLRQLMVAILERRGHGFLFACTTNPWDDRGPKGSLVWRHDRPPVRLSTVRSGAARSIAVRRRACADGPHWGVSRRSKCWS